MDLEFLEERLHPFLPEYPYSTIPKLPPIPKPPQSSTYDNSYRIDNIHTKIDGSGRNGIPTFDSEALLKLGQSVLQSRILQSRTVQEREKQEIN